MKLFRAHAVRVTAFAAAVASAPAGSQTISQPTPQPAAPNAASSGETIQLHEELNSRLTVPIRIDGKGPYSFVVDTASERTAVSDALARRLSLEPAPSVRLHSMSGESDVATALIPQLQVSRRRVRNIRAPILQQQHIRASGILGIDALQSHRVDFDFMNRIMKVVPSGSMPAEFRDCAIVVTADKLLGRLILTDVRINGEKVTAVVDTGSAITIGNEALRRLLERKGKSSPTTPVELTSVTGGKVQGDYMILRNMRLGEIPVRKLPVAFAGVHPFTQLGLTDKPAVMIGMDVLGMFARVSVDFATREVLFLMPGSNAQTTTRFTALDRRRLEKRLAVPSRPGQLK